MISWSLPSPPPPITGFNLCSTSMYPSVVKLSRVFMKGYSELLLRVVPRLSSENNDFVHVAGMEENDGLTHSPTRGSIRPGLLSESHNLHTLKSFPPVPAPFLILTHMSQGILQQCPGWGGGTSVLTGYFLVPPKPQSSEINQNKTVSIKGNLFMDRASRCFDTDNRFPAKTPLPYFSDVSQFWPGQKYS